MAKWLVADFCGEIGTIICTFLMLHIIKVMGNNLIYQNNNKVSGILKISSKQRCSTVCIHFLEQILVQLLCNFKRVCLCSEIFINLKNPCFAAGHGVGSWSLNLNLMLPIPNFSKESYTDIQLNTHQRSFQTSTIFVHFSRLSNLHLFFGTSHRISLIQRKIDITLDKGNYVIAPTFLLRRDLLHL